MTKKFQAVKHHTRKDGTKVRGYVRHAGGDPRVLRRVFDDELRDATVRLNELADGMVGTRYEEGDYENFKPALRKIREGIQELEDNS